AGSDREDRPRFVTFTDAAVLAESRHGTVVAAGSYKPPKGIGGTFKGAGVGPSPAYSYQASVAEVSVDVETGTLTVDKLTTAHDCGRALNPANVEGQVEGSAYMGYGEIVVEEQVFRGGLHKKPSLLDYKLPTSLDTPALEAIVVESVDPEGPFGAKEAGEGPLNPVIPAIANAVYDGTDVYPNMKRRQYTPETLVSLDRVQGRRGVHANGSLRIGAGTTLTEIAEHELVRERYAALATAAGLVSTPQLRNMGTVGGNICLDTRCNWYDQSLFWRTAEGYCMKTHASVVCRVATSSPRCLAVASADTVPALIALGASAVVANAQGERRVAIADLYREDGISYLTLERGDVV